MSSERVVGPSRDVLDRSALEEQKLVVGKQSAAVVAATTMEAGVDGPRREDI